MYRSLRILIWTIVFTLLFAIFAPMTLAAPALSALLGR